VLGFVISAEIHLHAQAAKSYDSTFFQALRWRSIGPARGGRSLTAAGSASRPFEYYFGAVGGGLWKTTDGGVTWRPVTDGQLKSSSVGAVAVSEANPDVVYIGMGETQLRGKIMQGDGVYKSTDAGKTWKHSGLSDTQAIARIRIHPTNPDLVFVAALGHPYGPNDERGVFKSTDGGQTWKKVLFKSSRAGAVDLCFDPTNPNLFYAGSQGALLTRFDRATGHTRDIQVYPLFFSGMPAKDLKERWQWPFPIVFSPHDPKVLYTSSQHLWRTRMCI
jgi:photosystem II stability/assembly factor-like uncharacterized protein